MEGRMATTPICNPHICRVLLGTAGYFGVLWGAVGYCVYCRVLEVLWSAVGYGRVLLGTAGHCWVLPGTAWY